MLKIHRLFFVLFYLLFSISYFCEIACDPNCDPSKTEFTTPIEECSHSTCELSHQDKHNYVKDDNNDSSKKLKILKDGLFLLNKFEIITLKGLHHTQTVLNVTAHSYTYFYPNRKRFVLFQRLKVFNA